MADEAPEEGQGLTPEQAAAIVDEALARDADPIAYEKAQRLDAVDAQFAPILAVADADTLTKAQGLVEARKAEIEADYAPPRAPEPEPLQSVSSLGLAESTSGATSVWRAEQYVEPERDGAPWCTWADAEQMLVFAAKAAMRGAAGVKATGYKLIRDDQGMTLTLELV